MKEYQFQYTKTWETLVVFLFVVILFIATEALCIYNNINSFLSLISGFGLAFLLFQSIKRKAIHVCTVRLSDSSAIFKFENGIKNINFKDLISYKFYSDKNGPILSLKSKMTSFKIIANNNFCKSEDFKMFCKDILENLDNYRNSYNSELIREGSLFTRKSIFYFLVLGTVIYLSAFFICTNRVRVAVGISGGFFVLIMWLKYFIVNKNQNTKNRS